MSDDPERLEEALPAYEIGKVLGRGGWGVVFGGRHRYLDREVAIKQLPAAFAADPATRRRFASEARVLASLDHPHVVPVYDYLERDDLCVLVMEQLPGGTLRERSAGEGFTAPAATAVTLACAAGLNAAHARGVLHRDIKPENMLYTVSGVVKVTDFGIAKVTGSKDTAVTRAGDVLGTAAYIAPEQVRGEALSPATDVYGLATMLYELLAGDLPFPDDGDTLSLMFKHAYEEPTALHTVAPDIPEPVATVVMTGLASDPVERFTGAETFATTLAAAGAAAWGTGWLARENVPVLGAPTVLAAADRDPNRPRKARAPAPPPSSTSTPGETGPLPPLPKRPDQPGSSAPRAGSGPTTAAPSLVPDSSLRRDPWDLGRMPAGPSPAPASAAVGGPPTEVVPAGAAAGRVPGRSAVAPPPPDVTYPSPPGLPSRRRSGSRHHRPDVALPAAQPGRWPLRPDYQPAPGPLRYPSPLPFLGHQHVVDDLRVRLRLSPGGSILVTGAVGAGKTTVVARALDELHTELVSTTSEPTPVVVVWETVTRPTSPEELLARLVRGLAEALERAGVVARLAPEVAELLDATHRRTFAPFALAELEHDVVALLGVLGAGARSETTPSRRWFRRGGGEPWTGRVVVVLDDVDELTGDGPGMASFENLLRALRSVLTAAGSHVVVIAGVEVLDAARRSETRGGSVFSAVFGRQIYLDSLPRGSAVELLRGVLLAPGPEHDTLAEHLEYRSRGIPRLLLGELDALVEWHPDGPHVVVDPARATSIAFHAALERRVGPLWAQSRPRGPLAHHLDIDRRRAATYLVLGWALDRRGTTFTASDLVADRVTGGHRHELASDDECVGLLRELAAVGILTAREPDSPRATFVGTPGPTETVYRLTRSVTDALARTGPAPRELGRVDHGRYVLLEELGRGALGRTYRAHDTFTTRDVAITMLDAREQHDDLARERFRRGVDLARQLGHPLLATSLGTLSDGGRLGLVAEFVPGLPLDELLERGPLAPPVAVDLTLGLLDLLHHLHGAEVVRLDLTPSHIVITPDGRPVLVGLGPAHRVDADDAPTGAVVGTPLYLSPEALAGRPVDARSDLYSLGLILVEMLTAQPARQGTTATIMARATTRPVDVGTLPCSPELRAVIEALLDPDPDARFADPAELVGVLETVPERT